MIYNWRAVQQKVQLVHDHESDAVRAATDILGITYAVGANPSNSATLHLF